MTDLGLNHTLNGNANVENEHANAAAGASSDGALHASGTDAAYDGSAGMDATYSAHVPEPPGIPDASAHVPGEVGGALPDVPVEAPDALGAAGGVPTVPDGAVDGALGGGADVATDGASVSLDAMLDGMLDVMGDLVAQLSGSLTAFLGF